jgi:hypothetical protein
MEKIFLSMVCGAAADSHRAFVNPKPLSQS